MPNRYGVDTEYLKKELRKLEQTLDNRTPEELWRYFDSLANIYKPNAIIEHGYIIANGKKD